MDEIWNEALLDKVQVLEDGRAWLQTAAAVNSGAWFEEEGGRARGGEEAELPLKSGDGGGGASSHIQQKIIPWDTLDLVSAHVLMGTVPAPKKLLFTTYGCIIGQPHQTTAVLASRPRMFSPVMHKHSIQASSPACQYVETMPRRSGTSTWKLCLPSSRLIICDTLFHTTTSSLPDRKH